MTLAQCITGDWEARKNIDHDWIDRCDEVWVLMLDKGGDRLRAVDQEGG